MAMIQKQHKYMPFFGKFLSVLIILFYTSFCQTPFETGFSMQNLGTIHYANSISSRQPWTNASAPVGPIRFTVGLSVVSFYDAMDNLSGDGLYLTELGCCIPVGPLTMKCAGTLFDALGLLRTCKGFFSMGYSLAPAIRLSGELQAQSAFLVGVAGNSRRGAACGISAWVSFGVVSVDVSCANIALYTTRHPTILPPFEVRFGLHTNAHEHGSQGVALHLQPLPHLQIQACMGYELFVHKNIAIHAGVGTNPFLLSCGITASLATMTNTAALVYHPVLGFSKGIGLEYIRK
ncbi:MAG: hypothetical protein JW795_18075 [Chitinivibrionales bacterium]|nr:hypothetical protein [Chitinivibrionales bacterium]